MRNLSKKEMMNRVEFRQKMPLRTSFCKEAFLIYDRRLLRLSTPLKNWIESFEGRYGVRAGEDLKALDQFPGHMQEILKKTRSFSRHQSQIVALGGGSVGDFAGFVASVLKRGVSLHHIPSTWLAAIDSSHGGKTALNVSGIKNQIGSFHFAEKITIVHSLLKHQPEKLEREALSELVKASLIHPHFWRKLSQESFLDKDFLWRNLPQAIEVKYSIVAKDPEEVSGLRQILNLGHTLGHVFESHYGWSHGYSVGQGLIFAISWSVKRRFLSQDHGEEILRILSENFAIQTQKVKKIPFQKAKKLLLSDKKISGRQKISFIFLKENRKKKTVEPFIAKVHLDDLMKESLRQGWIHGG